MIRSFASPFYPVFFSSSYCGGQTIRKSRRYGISKLKQLTWRNDLKSGFICILLILSFRYTIAQELQFPMDDGRHKKADFENWLIFSHLTASDSSRFGVAIFFFTGKIIGLRASGVYVMVADEQQKVYTNYKKIQLPIINRATHTEGRDRKSVV